jgi:hypothetical protein
MAIAVKKQIFTLGSFSLILIYNSNPSFLASLYQELLNHKNLLR